MALRMTAGFIDTGSNNYTSSIYVPDVAGGVAHLVELITRNLGGWTRSLPETAEAYRRAVEEIRTWTEPREIRVANRRVFFIRPGDGELVVGTGNGV